MQTSKLVACEALLNEYREKINKPGALDSESLALLIRSSGMALAERSYDRGKRMEALTE